MVVEDDNYNSPVLEQHIYQQHIPENSKVGTKVMMAYKVVAMDPNLSDQDGVQLEPEPFDREEKEVHYLRLHATDTVGNVGEEQMVIHVTERNDHQQTASSEQSPGLIVKG